MKYHIEGRRWFQKTYGNTYCSVRIFKDGEQVAYLPMEYGYGDYYLQRAHKWLGQNGHPEMAAKHNSGATVENTTIWLREHGHSYSVIDVSRQRDL